MLLVASDYIAHASLYIFSMASFDCVIISHWTFSSILKPYILLLFTMLFMCDHAAVRPDAHTAHPGCQYLQLLGRGTAPSGGCRQEDRGRFPDSVDQLLVSTAARLALITVYRSMRGFCVHVVKSNLKWLTFAFNPF